jgi:hypothetical protein
MNAKAPGGDPSCLPLAAIVSWSRRRGWRAPRALATMGRADLLGAPGGLDAPL